GRVRPPLLSVPPELVERSLRAAVVEAEPAARPAVRPRRSRRWALRWSFGGVAVAAAAAVAIAIALSTVSGHTRYRRIATLAGAGNAAGYVAVGPANGAVEPVVVSITHLRPAAPRHYYEIWFQTGSQQVPGVAFTPSVDGTAELRFTAPNNTRWMRCWVTRQSLDHPGAQTIVMRATGAPQPF